MALLTAATLFLSAFLLFSVQPLVGRMLLPLLGGSPAVWNTCLVFFQAALLAGYLYAHRLTSKLAVRTQLLTHLLLLAVPLIALPIAVRFSVPIGQDDYPVGWLTWLLLTMAGLPFFVVATTGPLLQRWFASTGRGDPYFLYAASNAGSMLGLLAYPFLIEPAWSISEQSRWWSFGYFAFAGMVVLCGIAFHFTMQRSQIMPDALDRPSLPKWRWIALAFVPSSWLMAVTAYLSTDLAAIPLLWVVPLALYLLTFIIAFSRIRLPLQFGSRVVAIGSLMLMLTILMNATEPLFLVVGVHLVVFFLATLYCHGTLAAERPPASRLTEFYLWLSVGGMLGGIFNAIVAPLFFAKIGLLEYPLMIAMIGLFRPTLERYPARWSRDLLYPFVVGVIALGLVLLVNQNSITQSLNEFSESSGLPKSVLHSALIFGLPSLIVFTFIDYPRRFVFGLLALFVAGTFDPGEHGRTIHTERNFLGVLRVTVTTDDRFVRLIHGNTIHGQQIIGPQRDPTPLTYYHPTGPAGQVFLQLMQPDSQSKSIAVVGLGTGSLAYYGQPNEDWTFYELDPTVERIARDPRYFTFMADSRARSLKVITGDARLRLEDAKDGEYRLIVLDAFSSDAIPMHLLTAEVLELYRRKLTPDGLLIWHLSNRYLELPPIVGRLAETADPPWSALVGDDLFLSDIEKQQGKFPSRWVILARRSQDLQLLKRGVRWSKIVTSVSTPRWTDDFANLWSAFRRSEDMD